MIRGSLLLATLLLLAGSAAASEAAQGSHLIEVRLSGITVNEPLAGAAAVAINGEVQEQKWSADPSRPIQVRFVFAVASLRNESLVVNLSSAAGDALLLIEGSITESDIVVSDSYVSPVIRLEENATSLLIVTSPVEGRFRAQVTYRDATTAPDYPARLVLDIPNANSTQTLVKLNLLGRVATGQAELTAAPATMTFALIVDGPNGPIYVQNGTMDWVTGALAVRTPGADDTRADAVLAETAFDPARSSGGTGLGLPNNVLTRSARVAQITEPRAPVGVTVRIGAPMPVESGPLAADEAAEESTEVVPVMSNQSLPASIEAPRSTASSFARTLTIIGATAAVISATAAVGTWALRARSRRRRAEYDQQFAREVLGR